MRDLYALETSTTDGMSILTGPMTIPDAMALVDEHVTPNGWHHRYRPITPTDQAIRHWTASKNPIPPEGSDLMVALRRAIIGDPNRDGLDDYVVTDILAHVDPHRPWQMWVGEPECLLGECDDPRRPDGACEGLMPGDRLCVACTAIIDSRSEFGPHIECRVAWPCGVVQAAARQYKVALTEVSA